MWKMVLHNIMYMHLIGNFIFRLSWQVIDGVEHMIQFRILFYFVPSEIDRHGYDDEGDNDEEDYWQQNA